MGCFASKPQTNVDVKGATATARDAPAFSESTKPAAKPNLTASDNRDTPTRDASSVASNTVAEIKKTLRPQLSVLSLTKRGILLDANPRKMTDDYTLGDFIGAGGYGSVYHATHIRSGKLCACKIMQKATIETTDEALNIRQEVKIWRMVCQQNNLTDRCVYLFDTYEDPLGIYMIMEICQGGTMIGRMENSGLFTEKDTAFALRSILTTLARLHEMGIIHRDITLENFLYKDKSPGSPLKITDFGRSTLLNQGDSLDDAIGTPYYVAPEVLLDRYDHKADVFSAGVILYILLTGGPPFEGDEEEVLNMAVTKEPDFENPVWKMYSPDALTCCRALLAKDPAKRPSAQYLLDNDPWLKEVGSTASATTHISREVLYGMKRFYNMKHLKKEALRMLIKFVDHDTAYLVDIKKAFEDMDVDKDGGLTKADLQKALEADGKVLNEEQMDTLFATYDIDGKGTIKYEEFVAVMTDIEKLVTNENIYTAFIEMDVDHDGFITADDIEKVLKDTNIDREEAVKMVQEINASGQIDYEEFCAMLRQDRASRPAGQARSPDGRADREAPDRARPVSPEATRPPPKMTPKGMPSYLFADVPSLKPADLALFKNRLSS